MIVRLGALVLTVLVIWLIVSLLRDVRPRLPKPVGRRRPARSGGHEWEPRTQKAARRVKGVLPETSEDRKGILAFLDSRDGVEAYMEPKTMMHPLSVVLVAHDGEWKRFALAHDAFLRDLSRTRGLAVYDANRVGYPERMRRYRRPDPPPR